MIRLSLLAMGLFVSCLSQAFPGFTFRDHTPSVLQYEARSAAGADVLYTQTCQPFIDCHVDSSEWPKSARYIDVSVISASKKTHVDSLNRWFGFGSATITCELKSIVPGAVFIKCH